MIKYNVYSIQNNEGQSKDVVVKAAAPNTLKDSLIGGGIIISGIIYLTVTAFKYGAKKFDEAECQTMKDLGIM